ncbi:hypothetical protein [Lampropedia puyangensis]|uniref:hypothetical protein n=1 Tax=Lampropedia puyangensis TaxID=1330072 RepID=UPI00130509D4|nr:hypothetical protein [Lampropedia puyangensis]
MTGLHPIHPCLAMCIRHLATRLHGYCQLAGFSRYFALKHVQYNAQAAKETCIVSQDGPSIYTGEFSWIVDQSSKAQGWLAF